MSDKELAGKVAVVTGSGRNIGKAIALALAAGGAAVMVNARSNKGEADAVVREIEAGGGKAVAVIGDISDPATAKNLAAAAQKLGRLDFLVNNAAIRKEAPLDKMTFERMARGHRHHSRRRVPLRAGLRAAHPQERRREPSSISAA